MGLYQHRGQKTSKHLAVSLFYLITLAVVASMTIGCPSGSIPVTPANTAEPEAAIGQPTASLSSPHIIDPVFEKLLGLVPDTPETRAYVRIVNHALLAEALVFPPQSNDSSARRGELFRAHRTFLNFYDTPSSIQPNLTEYLALDPDNIDQSLQAGTRPSQWEILGGQFDPQATEQALSGCSGECLPPDAIEEYQGVPFYSWGEDFKGSLLDRLKPPAFDKQGRGGAASRSWIITSTVPSGLKV